ncbi:MAG: protein kinase [Planctomycetota bacterium]
MSLQCPECQQQLSTEGTLPRFCSNCGASLEAITGKLKPVTATPTTANQTLDRPLDATTNFSNPLKSATPADKTAEVETQIGDAGGAAQPLPAGSQIGRFQIEHALGAGGMGTVYKATDTTSGQNVALKLLSRSVRSTDESIQRFQRESQIAASINHPRSTFVYGAGQHEGQFFITMELMTGGTLDDIVKQDGPIQVGKAVDYVLDMIDGLRAAHEAGIVHRDLKPSNCFLDHMGRVKIGDFGLAKSFLSDTSLTQTGAFMGTPQYAAPEQLRTSEVDERADIYAIGGTLFYLLAGRPPFVGNAAQVISSIASEEAPRINSLDKSIPRGLCNIIHQTLEKSPNRRPENLEELRQRLLPYSTRGSTPADSGRRMAAFFIDVFAISMIVGFVSNGLGMLVQAMPVFDINLATIVLTVSTGVFYFSGLEFVYGTTLGKWLLGMRISTITDRRPGYLSCLIRAAMMPGLMYLSTLLPGYFLNFDPTFSSVDVDLTVQTASLNLLFSFGGWLISALMFVTARKSNGFRGLHELASGTRVVRVSGTLEVVRLENIPVTLPISSSLAAAMRSSSAEDTLEYVSPERSGSYKIVGELGRLSGTDAIVQQARDESLERDVWVIELEDDNDWLSESRKQVNRSTRMRILDLHEKQGKRAIVTEAIRGMPLAEYVRSTSGIDWRGFRPALQELVIELARASEDQTLPSHLSLSQIWINQFGHIKLLEYPIAAVASGLNQDKPVLLDKQLQLSASSSNWNNEERNLTPVELIKAILNVFVRHHVVPAHVLTFQQEIDVLNFEKNGLELIGDRLGELAELPSAWKWDDRVSVMASTVGLEFSIITTFVLMIAFASATFEPGLRAISIGFFVVGSIATWLLGLITEGGLVFRISGILVRENRTLKPASRVRCGFRTWLSWLPTVIGTTLLSTIIVAAVRNTHEKPELLREIGPMVPIVLLGMTLIYLFAMLGAGYSILRPSRGVQDVICGTRLIRK